MLTIEILDGNLLNSDDVRLIRIERRGEVYVGIAYCGEESEGYPVIRQPTYEEAKQQAVLLARFIFGPVVWPPAKAETMNGVEAA